MNNYENKTKPTYYGTGFDVIDFCQKNNLDFMQGNVIKYVTRYKEKNGKEDLLKAREYIDSLSDISRNRLFVLRCIDIPV